MSGLAETERILFANEAFYTAFMTGDIGAMDAVWARDAPLVCLHPGARPLLNRDEIMASWRDILVDGGVAAMRFHTPEVAALGPVALVVCYETFEQNGLVATNGFVVEDGVWRMVLHQAGPCPDAPIPDPNISDSDPVH